MYQGILIFILIFILFLFFTTKDKIYIYYFFYVSLISLFSLDKLGLAFNILSPVSNYIFFLSGNILLILGSTAWLTVILFFLNLTKINFQYYKVYKLLIKVNIFFSLILCLRNIFIAIFNLRIFQIDTYFFNILLILNLFTIFFSVFSRVIKKDKLALFYLCCNAPLVAGFLLFYFNQIGFTNFQVVWSNPIVLGLSTETFLLSFGFAYRFNLIKIDKEKLLIDLNEQQKSSAMQVLKIQENDRERIARDLHDDLGSNLAAIKMNLQKLKLTDFELSKKIIQLVDKASESTRIIAHNLMPPEFGQTKIDDLLNIYLQQLSYENMCKFRFYSSGSDHHFNKPDELMIYRILMELANNILKHAQASEATIQLIYYENYLEIMAEDNGIGFSEKQNDGIGLKNIYSRVNYLKGKLKVDSGKSGTTIMIQIPYS